MTADVLTAFEDALKGQGCTVKRRNYDWAFDFGEGGEITIAAPWRIVRRGAIAHADTDDGQQFGLPAPIDGEVRCNDLLAQVRVAAVMVDRVTADICVQFDDGTRLELFNNSSGYEGWQATFRSEGETIAVIGMGGGNIAFVGSPERFGAGTLKPTRSPGP